MYDWKYGSWWSVMSGRWRVLKPGTKCIPFKSVKEHSNHQSKTLFLEHNGIQVY